MQNTFQVQIDAWNHGDPIPARFAFGQPGEDGPFALGGNVSPGIRWEGAPAGTKSFALICHDPDVPSQATDVNQEDRTVPADLPRVDFFHWTLISIPADVRSIAEGAASEAVTPTGKPVGEVPFGTTGRNDYTAWFSGDPAMEGVYGGYDGPCPPWNDSIVHHYHFTVFALDVESLPLDGPFGGDDVRKAIEGHVLAQATHMGTYSMNPAVEA